MIHSATKSNLTPNNRTNLQSAVGSAKSSSSSSDDLVQAVRKALSEGVGPAQIKVIAEEECINEVDYAEIGPPDVEVESVLNDPPAAEKPKKKRRSKNASV